MAQAYLDYACTGKVTKKTTDYIEHLLSKNNVYTYFRLPLLLMQNAQEAVDALESKYEWIDFKRTESEWCRFLKQLRNT